MLVVPAIDLLAGRPVRLLRGAFDQVTGFGSDPVDLARQYAEAGAPLLHLVDLDGAKAGAWQNLHLIGAIAAAVPIPVQAGGGARRLADVEVAFDRGVHRVVVSTTAVESPQTFGEWAARYGDRLTVSLDLRGAGVAVRGWTSESSHPLTELARSLVDAGAARLIVTSIERDGTMEGADLSGLMALRSLGVPVMVAGGVAGYRDLETLRDAGAEAAIVGRALLQGTISLDQAMQVAS